MPCTSSPQSRARRRRSSCSASSAWLSTGPLIVTVATTGADGRGARVLPFGFLARLGDRFPLFLKLLHPGVELAQKRACFRTLRRGGDVDGRPSQPHRLFRRDVHGPCSLSLRCPPDENQIRAKHP